MKKSLVGIVTSAKAAKTLTVKVESLVQHAKYNKYIRRETVVYAHDEKREAHEGDQVEVVETRPLSKNKCWRLLRIVTRAKMTSGGVE